MPDIAQPQTLNRLDSHPISGDGREIRAFIIARNEVLRMPYLLEYHRKLGVQRFFILDNGSTDGMTEFLLQQADCHVFYTEEKYAQMDWLKTLLDEYGADHWSLVIDADELFVYPHSEVVRLRGFCDFLEQERAECVYSFMIDMYSAGNIADAVCVPGKPFPEICPYFDKAYAKMHRFHLPFKRPLFPATDSVGGPRLRLFYPAWRFIPSGFPWQLFAKAAEYVAMHGRKYAWLQHLHRPPILFKIPLLKWKKDDNRHLVHTLQHPLSLSSVTTALLHFKFFSEFHKNAEIESARGLHANGASEYKRYLRRLQKNPDINFMYKGSQKYGSSADLLANGLVTTSAAYERFAERLAFS